MPALRHIPFTGLIKDVGRAPLQIKVQRGEIPCPQNTLPYLGENLHKNSPFVRQFLPHFGVSFALRAE